MLVGFKCPPGTPTEGTKNDFAHCIDKCPHRCHPRAVLKVIADRETGNEHAGDMLSPTAMSSCARKLILSRTTDYYAEPQRLYWATRGALYHAFLEVPLSGVFNEQRIYKWVTKGPLSPWLISGRIDYYDENEKAIEDFKTKSDKGIFPLYKDALPNEQYVWQLNIYRWLAHGGHFNAVNGPQVFWPVDQLRLHFLFMNRVVTTGNVYREQTVLKGPTGPNSGKKYRNEIKGTRKIVGKTPYGWNIWEFDVKIPAVPIYSFAEVEDYLIERGPERRRGFAEPGHMPEGVIGDPYKGWECGYCDVKEACDVIEATRQSETERKI